MRIRLRPQTQLLIGIAACFFVTAARASTNVVVLHLVPPHTETGRTTITGLVEYVGNQQIRIKTRTGIQVRAVDEFDPASLPTGILRRSSADAIEQLRNPQPVVRRVPTANDYLPRPVYGDSIVATIRGHSFTQQQLNDWYLSLRRNYLVVNGGLVSRSQYESQRPTNAQHLEGKILQVHTPAIALVSDDDLGVVAVVFPGGTANLAENQDIETWTRRDGVYSYTTIFGAPSQIAKFVLDPTALPAMMTYNEFYSYLLFNWYPEMAERFQVENEAREKASKERESQRESARQGELERRGMTRFLKRP